MKVLGVCVFGAASDNAESCILCGLEFGEAGGGDYWTPDGATVF